MSSRHVSRRFVVTALGSGVALAPVLARSAVSKLGSQGTDAEAPPPAPPEADDTPSFGARLIAPLTVGMKLGGCTLNKIADVTHGALGILLSDSQGHAFSVEVCARDEASPPSPAETEKFQLYLVNEGDGSIPTVEEHGIAAMAIASAIRRNEREVDASAFLTLRQRLAYHPSEILRPA